MRWAEGSCCIRSHCRPFRLNTERFTQEESEAEVIPVVSVGWEGSCERLRAPALPGCLPGLTQQGLELQTRPDPSLADEQTESLRARGALLQGSPHPPQRGQR